MTLSPNTGEFIKRNREKQEFNSIDVEMQKDKNLRQAYSALYEGNAMSSIKVVNKEQLSAVSTNKKRSKKYCESNVVKRKTTKETEPDSNTETLHTAPTWVPQKDIILPRNYKGKQALKSNQMQEGGLIPQIE